MCDISTWKKVTSIGICYNIKFPLFNSKLIQWDQPTLQYAPASPSTTDLQYGAEFGTFAVMAVGSHENDTFLSNPILLISNVTWLVTVRFSLYERFDSAHRKCYAPNTMAPRNFSKIMCALDCEEKTFSSCMGCNYFGYFMNYIRMNKPIKYCDLITQPRKKTACVSGTDRSYLSCMQNCFSDCREMMYSISYVKMNNKRFNQLTTNIVCSHKI